MSEEISGQSAEVQSEQENATQNAVNTIEENDAAEHESSAETEETLADESDKAPAKDPWYKKRIDELTKDKHEARRHAERLEKMLEQIQRQTAQPVEEAQPAIQPPDPNNYAGGQYDPRYIQDQLAYTKISAIEEAKAQIAKEFEQKAAYERQVQAQARLEAAEAAARQKFADYDAAIEGITSDPRLAQNPTIRQALLGMDNGPEIAYALGKNLDVAYEIAQMNPIQAGMRLAELINRAPRKVQNAPKPISPINATGGIGKKSYADMTTAEYIKARNEEERAARQSRYKR